MERMSRVRSLLLLAGIPLLTWQIWLLARPFFASSDVVGDLPLVGVTRLLGLALYLSWAWLAFTIVVAAGEALATGRLRGSGRLTPRVTRRLVAAMCGLGVIAASGAAQATTHGDLDGLSLPDRVVGRAVVAPPPVVSQHAVPAPAPTTAQRTSSRAGGHVTVRPGDCLWAIAHRHHTNWRAIYDVNRELIGDDPDLIFPGQRLVLPDSANAEARR